MGYALGEQIYSVTVSGKPFLVLQGAIVLIWDNLKKMLFEVRLFPFL
jgi:hypothetical protein